MGRKNLGLEIGRGSGGNKMKGIKIDAWLTVEDSMTSERIEELMLMWLQSVGQNIEVLAVTVPVLQK